jgi:fido (protein-threonine AMPylation protein)
MAQNRFARQPADLDPDERRLAEAAIAAAQRTFAGFKERAGSEYHRAPGLTPEQTWTRVAEELGRVAALAALEGYRDKPLEVADIELIHRAIFGPVFGEKTLSLRHARQDEVTYPIVLGDPEHPRHSSRRGSGGKQVRQNLGKTLKVFEREVADLVSTRRQRPTVEEAALPATKLYSKTIGIHPFFDGNGRTAWAVLSYALQRCGLVEVAIAPTASTRWALGRALRRDGSQSYQPLAGLVAETIKSSSLESPGSTPYPE